MEYRARDLIRKQTQSLLEPCMDHFDQLMKDIKEPQITLCQSDVYFPERPFNVTSMIHDARDGRIDFYHEESQAIADIVKNFECIICKGIPIQPNECSSCEVIFCKQCIESHKMHTAGFMSRRCPQCKQSITNKQMNRNLIPMTIEKLKFKHKCLPSCEPANASVKEESAFDKFKKTAKYKEIMLKMGKEVPPTAGDTQTAQGDDAFNQPINEDGPRSGARTSKRQAKMAEKQAFKSKRLQQKMENSCSREQDEKDKKDQLERQRKEAELSKLREVQIMSYSEYVTHLKHENCPKFVIFECPAKCDGDQTAADGTQASKCENKKYSYDQLEHHLLNECPNVFIRCPRCDHKELRCKFSKKHDLKKCVQILQEKQMKIDKEYKELKKKRRSMLEQFNTLREANEENNNNNRARHNIIGELLLDEPYEWELDPPQFNWPGYNYEFESNNLFSQNRSYRRESPFLWPRLESMPMRATGFLRSRRDNNNRSNNIINDSSNYDLNLGGLSRGSPESRNRMYRTRANQEYRDNNNNNNSSALEPIQSMIQLFDQTRNLISSRIQGTQSRLLDSMNNLQQSQNNNNNNNQ